MSCLSFFFFFVDFEFEFFFLFFFLIEVVEICFVNEIDENVQEGEAETELKNSDSIEIKIEENVQMCEGLTDKKNEFWFFDGFFTRELNF